MEKFKIMIMAIELKLTEKISFLNIAYLPDYNTNITDWIRQFLELSAELKNVLTNP